jgi:hypothetical protein
MADAADSETRLNATFRLNVNGETVEVRTVGQAYRFLTRLGAVEWMEFKALHAAAIATLEAAAENGMTVVQATAAMRALLLRAKLL